ncbi:MAG: alpha-L-fucosidase, partial [Bacteroidales bacterium]|nr:alpha-L-fucosidase [Bacteroidales bacterium]
YSALASRFNPVRFDARDWVGLASKAGQKYLIITAKHHDGFAMYHSGVSSYNIVDATPFGRDVLSELYDACKEEGIKFGFYYSHVQDWYHPGAGGCDWDRAHDGDFGGIPGKDITSPGQRAAREVSPDLDRMVRPGRQHHTRTGNALLRHGPGASRHNPEQQDGWRGYR